MVQVSTSTVLTNARRALEPQPVASAVSSQRLLELARRVAASDCTVLIVGESGTGKEVLARFVHRFFRTQQRPLRGCELRGDPGQHARGHSLRL